MTTMTLTPAEQATTLLQNVRDSASLWDDSAVSRVRVMQLRKVATLLAYLAPTLSVTAGDIARDMEVNLSRREAAPVQARTSNGKIADRIIRLHQQARLLVR